MTGRLPLGNSLDGVEVTVSDNVIGVPGVGNIIAANGGTGIDLRGSGHNTLFSNFIGTDVTGTSPLGNGLDGIDVNGSDNNVIGANGAGNIIAANQVGVYLFDGASTNVIQANLIGFPALNSPLGNTSGGVLIAGSDHNLVGGLTAAEGNLIAGSPAYSGIVLFGGSELNVVVSNTVLDNGHSGVYILNSPRNVIGLPGAGNTVAGNQFSGVDIEGTAATSNAVRYNVIVANAHDGVYLFQAPGNAIGGPGGAGNTILDSGFSGVHIDGTLATRNVVMGNTITGSKGYGVLIDDATLNVIGGPGDESNTLQGNAFGGIQVLVGGLPPVGSSNGNTIGTNNAQGQAFVSTAVARRRARLFAAATGIATKATPVKALATSLPAGPAGSFRKALASRARP